MSPKSISFPYFLTDPLLSHPLTKEEPLSFTWPIYPTYCSHHPKRQTGDCHSPFKPFPEYLPSFTDLLPEETDSEKRN